jgi:L-methionine (R)-S-oxide reductase
MATGKHAVFSHEVSPSMNLSPFPMQEWLAIYLQHVGGVAGTVHLRQGDGLALAAALNIPPQVVEVVRWVPRGKGMFGRALQIGEVVTNCGLIDEDSKGARPVGIGVAGHAAVALPIKDASGSVLAVLGVAFDEECEIGEVEIAQLLAAASSLPLSPRIAV